MSVNPRILSPWLVAACLFLLISVSLYVYDWHRSDEEILAAVQQGLQQDFDACITFYETEAKIEDKANPYNACILQYDHDRRLQSWTQSRFLPRHERLNLLDHLSRKPLISLKNRAYYQIKRPTPVGIQIVLIPILIEYEVKNQFLDPYYFLGRYARVFRDQGPDSYLKQIRAQLKPIEGPKVLRITDTNGLPILYISHVPTMPFRLKVRRGVALFLVLSIFCFVLFLRVYTLKHWHKRFHINVYLAFIILGIRGLIHFINRTGNYFDLDLFAPDILAFHALAPSLGDLTLNILTFTALMWVVYTHVFRLSNIWLRKVIRDPWVAWPAMLVSLSLSSLLLSWYNDVFEQITLNSQVDIEFSNIFKTDFYSYVILLDVGTLFLALLMGICLLLRVNIMYYRRYGFSWAFALLHIAGVIGLNYLLHPTYPAAQVIASVSLLGMGAVLMRQPFHSILKKDLVSYLLITLIVSVVVTYNVVLGVRLNHNIQAQEISEQLLESQATNTVLNFGKAKSRVEADIAEIRAKHATASDANDFRDWLNERYLRSNFKGFDVSLFLYDSTGARLDNDPKMRPVFNPEGDFQLEDRGGVRLSESNFLHQVPNPSNEYVDFFAGPFSIFLDNDSTNELVLWVELMPTSREARGLYPSLSMEQRVYEEVKLVNSFDHAIYREGILYTKRGKSAFSTEFPDYETVRSKTTRVRGEYHEYIGKKEMGAERLVVVRYPRQDILDLITTFSLTFYFFSLAGLIFITLPVMLMRLIRTRQLRRSIPLRAKIRLGLVSISVLPMLVIMGLLYPFVSQRYAEEARENLNDATLRILNQIEPAYNAWRNDPLRRLSALEDFREMIRTLEGVSSNDINIFDKYGVRLATTQPSITEAGIQTDLMNEVALDSLVNFGISDLVLKERIGNLEYLSGYRPILGKNGSIIGYVNVPYLARQDQLQDQVINFLAYLANIYLLVFLLINVVAVGISGTITQPLSLIQQRLSATKLGDTNEPIQYSSRDEIGAIVNAYNQMLVQLEHSEQKLSQNQRELAWRQMARQVAHEIKNPLTPMRLNIQHLVRAWKEQSPRLEKMFPKVMNSLMVQIDSLVRIANSFHEFAKMPEPIKSYVRVNEVLLEVVDLYTQSEDAIWLIDIPQEPFWTYADRDQLSRSFNNIIKNGLQALEENGIIHVSMRIFEDKARVEIKDNGKGMSAEVQKKIFEPSFSTKTSGMGLGLAIVRRIIEHTGGDISFRSEENVGTTFFITLPRVDKPGTQILPKNPDTP